MHKSVIGMSTATRHNGFTLLEILVVLIILSITVTFALLATGDFGRDRQARYFSRNIARLLTVVRQQAILQPGVYGVRFGKHSLQFFRWQDRWILMRAENLFRPRRYPPSWQVQVISKLDNVPGKPQILFQPVGTITPFTLYINQNTRVEGRANGDITLSM